MINISVPTSYTSSFIISTQQSRKKVNKGVGGDRMMKSLLGNVAFVQDETNGTSTSDVTGLFLRAYDSTRIQSRNSLYQEFLLAISRNSHDI